MRWLVTGAAGQLGHHLARALRHEDTVCLDHAALDIARSDAVDALIDELRPDVVVNAAAYTAVDAAETNERRAHDVNAAGPGNLASALARSGGRLVHVSTDYVFDGRAPHDASGRPRPYRPDDPVGPHTAYGRTKLAGERAVRRLLPDGSAVVRTAWVFGGPGPNFVDTIVRLSMERETLDVVADQVGSPTFAGDLAAALVAVGRGRVAGTLHFVNSGAASWYDLARAAVRLTGGDASRIRPTTSDRMPRPAQRPAWSVLGTDAWTAAGFDTPRHWSDALDEAIRLRQFASD